MKAIINRLYGWYGKKTVRVFFVVLLILIIAVLIISRRGEESADIVNPIRSVPVAVVSSLSNGSTIQLVGDVEAVEKADITTEVAGRVTSVNVEVGDQVAAGTILAELENASERAAVLQAEGSYEAALAAAAQSDIGVSEAETSLQSAENNALSVFRSAYTTSNDVVRNLIDELFSDPDSPTPGLRLEGFGETNFLNDERVELEGILRDWQSETISLSDDSNLDLALIEAEARTNKVLSVVDSFLRILPKQDQNSVFTNDVLNSYTSRFSSARTSIIGTLTSLDNAEISLENARDALTRIGISGTSGSISSANAQVKQSLGSLRAAQASLEKTIIRTPISGTVNLLPINPGDFVGSFELAASVANNGALLITTFVGESDRDRIAVGDVALIENRYEGVISSIAPAIDPVTKKVEVKIQTDSESIRSGDTVRISIDAEGTTLPTDEILTVPLTAVKFSAENGSVLTVEDGVIATHPVILGDVTGTSVVIVEGITSDMEIVIDARGLNLGQQVEAIR